MTGNGANTTIIRLESLSRTFQVGNEEVHALVDVSERVEKGEHVAIMGPSGSGKSTLLNILGCLDRPSGGRYHLDGRDVSRLDSPTLTAIRRNQIGFVFQFFHLIPRLTAAGNVELPMVFAGIPRAERQERVARAIADVGLSQRADHLPEQLSGGERQRIALARATIMQPSILLADEPTGNLDTKSGSAVLDILERLNDDGLTLLIVTHDPKVAQRADRIIVLVDGRVAKRVKDGRIREVMEILTAE
jgi:putative ABC transport system ATP-binding protein